MSGRSMGRGIAAFIGLAAPIHPKQRLVRRQRPIDEAADEARPHRGGIPVGCPHSNPATACVREPRELPPENDQESLLAGLFQRIRDVESLVVRDDVQVVSRTIIHGCHPPDEETVFPVELAASLGEHGHSRCRLRPVSTAARAAPFPRTKLKSNASLMQDSLRDCARPPLADVVRGLEGGAGLGADCRRERQGGAARGR